MNNWRDLLWTSAMVSLVLAVVVSLLVIIASDANDNVIVSTTGCCSIHTHKVLNEDIWRVRYNDNTNDELSYSEVVSSEYDMRWAVSEMQENCFTHHNHKDN